MAFDETLAGRVRAMLEGQRGIAEKRMFGGLAFLLDGNMCCGIVGKDLMLRLGDEGAAEALREPHVRPMDFTGKALKSMVYVAADGIRDRASLGRWIGRAIVFAGTLPARPVRARGRRARGPRQGTAPSLRRRRRPS